MTALLDDLHQEAKHHIERLRKWVRHEEQQAEEEEERRFAEKKAAPAA